MRVGPSGWAQRLMRRGTSELAVSLLPFQVTGRRKLTTSQKEPPPEPDPLVA